MKWSCGRSCFSQAKEQIQARLSKPHSQRKQSDRQTYGTYIREIGESIGLGGMW